MNDEFIDIKQLTDSKEVLLMEPHPFFQTFLTIFTIMLVCGVVWSAVCEIDIYVTAAGVVRPSGNISNVRIMNGGKTSLVNLVDGQEVKKGDVLLSFDQQSLRIRYEENIELLNDLNEDIELLTQYRECISNNENTMSTDTAKGKQYRLLVERYLLERDILFAQLDESQVSSQSLLDTAKLTLNNAEAMLERYSTEFELLQVYKKSVEEYTNYLSDADASNDTARVKYLSLWNVYQTEMESMQQTRDERRNAVNELQSRVNQGVATQTDLDSASLLLTNAENAIYSFKQSELASIDSQINTCTDNIESAEYAVEQAENDVETYSSDSGFTEMQIEKNQLDILTDVDSQLASRRSEQKSLTSENNSYASQLGDYEVAAPIDGVISLLEDINQGDVVQAGTVICNIIPHESDSFVVEMALGNRDRVGVEVGDEVKFRFDALPHQEYGIVKGKVTKISRDAQVNVNTGQSYYTAEASVENKPLTGNGGKTAQLIVGMSAEGRIVSEKKTVLSWLLDSLDFSD
ncbi:MAG: HlyD family secretion protein [Clostridiales bacterium]|nr:HlyD family secretion protein [Clostridiales bacterium]